MGGILKAQLNLNKFGRKEFVHFCLSTTFYSPTAIEIPLLPLGFGPLRLPWQPVNWLAG